MRLVIKKANDTVGEEREGTYAARAQTGYEKDGSPQYRYFRTMEEYKTYLANKNKAEGGSKDTDEDSGDKLKQKLDKEQKATKRKMQKTPSAKNLLVSKKENTKKSIRLVLL